MLSTSTSSSPSSPCPHPLRPTPVRSRNTASSHSHTHTHSYPQSPTQARPRGDRGARENPAKGGTARGTTSKSASARGKHSVENPAVEHPGTRPKQEEQPAASTTRAAQNRQSVESRVRETESSPKHTHLRDTTTPPPTKDSENTSVDAGTQYTPPDWPPTSSRSSLRKPAEFPIYPESSSSGSSSSSGGVLPRISSHPRHDPSSRQLESKGSVALARSGDKGREAPIASPQPPPPAEPRVRVTPNSSLRNAGQSSASLSGESGSGSNVAGAAGAANAASTRRHSQISSSDGSAGMRALSPPKRQRGVRAQAKTLPRDFTECPAKDLGVLIADLMMDLIRVNDEIPLADGNLTRFHSRSPPAISVHDYIQRLTLHATLQPSILLAMVFLIDVICEHFPGFTINSLTVHRFLIASATVCSKGLSDVFWTNQTYAKVGGVSIRELSMLELELLSRVEWQIVPNPEKLGEYYVNLVLRSEDYTLEEEQLPPPAEAGDVMDTDAPEQSGAGTGESNGSDQPT